MKRSILYLLAFTLAISLVACSRLEPGLLVFTTDPTNSADLQSMLEDAIKRGATRVRFPSGEWRWHCLGCGLHSAKSNPQEWNFGRELKGTELEKWLERHAVTAVEITIFGKVDVRDYFEVEKILTSRGIEYDLTVIPEADGSNPRLRLIEYSGPRAIQMKL